VKVWPRRWTLALIDMVERRVGIRLEARLDIVIESERIERELYFVAIEALNNALKHSEADQVNLIISRENDCMHLCVEDNGRGFDPSQASPGLGINNMRQRILSLGGDLRIDSVLDQGTKVIAVIPSLQYSASDQVFAKGKHDNG
jgi:NarL family two-component system sensor histidine kinase LiaS